MWKGVGADPKTIAEHAASYSFPRVIETINIGDRLDVDRPGVVGFRDLRESQHRT